MCQFHRAGAAGVGNRHHHVDIVERQFARHFFRQRYPHIHTRLIHRHAVHHRIGAREIHIFKQAGVEPGRFCALARKNLAVKAHKHRLARRNIALTLKSDAVEHHRFRSHRISRVAGFIGVFAQHQRADAQRVAESHHAVAGNQRHHAISAAHAFVQAAHGVKHMVHAQLCGARTGHFAAQFVRKHIEQHFRIGAGVDMAQVLETHVFIQLFGVGEVAVVRQHDAEGRAHIKRLRLGAAAGIAGCGIAHMRNAGAAGQIAHIAGAEHIAHHAFAFVHMKHIALNGDDARRILTAVLQHLQTVVKQLVYRLVRH